LLGSKWSFWKVHFSGIGFTRPCSFSEIKKISMGFISIEALLKYNSNTYTIREELLSTYLDSRYYYVCPLSDFGWVFVRCHA